MSEMTLLPETSSTHRRDEADELSMDELEVVVGGAPLHSWIHIPTTPQDQPIASSTKTRAVAITA